MQFDVYYEELSPIFNSYLDLEVRFSDTCNFFLEF